MKRYTEKGRDWEAQLMLDLESALRLVNYNEDADAFTFAEPDKTSTCAECGAVGWFFTGAYTCVCAVCRHKWSEV